MESRRIGQLLKNIYQRLANAYGQQYWWPADEPFEVMVGAILTQSASWRNAEMAITNLKKAGALSSRAIRRLSTPELAQIIRPCGYFNAKAVKLKALVEWLGEQYSDDISSLFSADVKILRKQLLAIHGIGPETADSILLYVVGKPVFVIDAYTRRIINRLGIAIEEESYDSYQRLFKDNLEADTGLFNEYHALLVKLAKDACLIKPICRHCCLKDICRFYSKDCNHNS